MQEHDIQCWSLYLLRREDGGLYTGITTDVERRFEAHRSGKGARCLRGKALAGIAFAIELGSRSLATRVEYRVKKLAKRDKEALIDQACSKSEILSFLGLED